MLPLGEVVISGVGGRFPESDSLEEFGDLLLANRDLVTEDDRRWPTGLTAVPSKVAKLKNIDRFDAAFFTTLAVMVS